MTISTWRAKLTLLVGGTLIATVLALAFAGPGAGATPTPTPPAAAAAHGTAGGNAPAVRSGDNGTVKIHRSTTPVTDRRNQPHVCVFYLDAFGFDSGQAVSWQVKSWPPTGDRTVVTSGVLTLASNGGGRTGDMTLPNGHYKLFWNFAGEHGFAKQKVFWVACGAPTPPPSGSPTPSESTSSSPSPSGSPTPASTATPSPSPAVASSSSSGPPGNGGLPITGWPLALTAAAGVALLGTGGTALVLARRRRGLPGR